MAVASAQKKGFTLGIRGCKHGAIPMKSEKRSPAVQHLGLFNDYVRIPFANGSSFASQFLYREFKKRGSEVTVIGPRDPAALAVDLPSQHVSLRSVPFRLLPGLFLPLPSRAGLQAMVDAKFDLAVAQTGSAFLEAGLWLRRNHGVPFVCVNTVHLPSIYDAILPAFLHKNALAHRFFQRTLIPWAEAQIAYIYNNSDALVVLSAGLENYWRERGVTVPIEVIPRSIEPKIFDRKPKESPYPPHAKKGGRLVVVCRHTREKNVVRLLDIFAQQVVPHNAEATLTLVGDGPDRDAFQKHAAKLGIAERCIWPGEVSQTDTPAWYRHADIFVYTSLSETYGQVVSEALWCGLPAVALDDKKGVADQIKHGSDGFLFDPKSPDCNREFGAAVLRLLSDSSLRRAYSERAVAKVTERSAPERCIDRYEEVFTAAKAHCKTHLGEPSGLSKQAPLWRWSAQMALIGVMGGLRAPATVNRHKQKPPPWDLDVPSHSEVNAG